MATPASPQLAPSPQDPDHHDHLPPSPSSTPTPSNPNSPKPTPPSQSSSPPKKTPPLPWTHQETTNLIQAYQEKWYSLKRGQLKASQWEEVAITVAARCGYDEPSKSATQCRHKIEKLRKRYRTEKLKPYYPNPWQFFDLMEQMERGPLPISARPMAMIKYQNTNSSDDKDSDSEGEVKVNYDDDSKKNKSKSINHIVRGEANINKSTMDQKLGGGNGRVLRVLRNSCFESDGGGEDDDDDEEEEEEEEDKDKDKDEDEEEQEGGGSGLAVELGAEIRAFAGRFVRMENKKIEMMRETERYRIEMENKRTEMILESQRKIVDTIGRAFGSYKKMKMAQGI